MNKKKSMSTHIQFGKLFTPKLLSLTIASISISCSAWAQNDSTDATSDNNQASTPIEEVQVLGIRQSLIDSIDAKRYSDTVVEMISADDIGGLPDVSIADALTRLPGITAVRTGGQASELNIRGLSGDFVFSSLNGREQVTTGGKRAIEFDQYPSELITQAAVYKSPKASLIEGGVAGTVDLRTANPLDNENTHTFNVSTRGMFNDLSGDVEGADDYGYRTSFSYQGKFLDDSLGFAVGYARLYQPNVSNQFIGLAYNAKQDVNNNGSEEAISEGFEAQQRGGEETRDGYMASLQWEPSETLSFQTDLFHSKFDSETFARGFRVKSLNEGEISNPTINNGAVTGATVASNGVDKFAVFTINDNDSRHTEVWSGGINGSWNDGPWSISTDISYSKADGEFVNGGSRALLYNDSNVADPTRASEIIQYKLNGVDIASFSSNRSYTNLNTMALTEVGMWPFINRNELTAYRLDIQYEIESGFISSVEAGIRYSEREYTATRRQAGYGSEFSDNTNGELPIQLTADMVKITQFGGDLSGFPNFLTINFDKAINAINAANASNGRAPFRASANWGNSWTMVQSGSVNENVIASYLQANIESQVFGKDLTGNVGIRVVESEQYSRGIQQIGSDLGVPIADENGLINTDFVRNKVGKEYTDILPSLNLNFHLTDIDQIRFAAAKVMARPPINKLQSGTSTWIAGDNTFNAASNSSPLLDPFYATQYDLTYEHYFEETKGAVIVAVFYKDIESFINNFTIDPYDFAADGSFIIPETNADNGQPVLSSGGEYQTAINNDNGGYIRGLELAYTQTFDFLPGIWSGLGVTASYSYTESEVEFQTDLSGNNLKIPLPGLSDQVFNGTAFFDYKNFSTRLSIRYRNDYVSEQVAVDPQLAFFKAETVLDYQASYSFDNGLSAVFQVNNLTDEPNRTYFGNESQTGTLQSFGRQFFLGINYSL